MRWVLLLVALVVGFALGRSDIGRSEFERSERRSDPATNRTDVAGHRFEPTEPILETLAPLGAGTTRANVVDPTTEALTDGFEGMVDQGALIPEGPEAVFVYTRSLGGSPWDEELSRDGLAVAPGIYDVWWIKSGVRIGRRARVEAGKVTRIRTAEGGAPFVPDGLAVISARVLRANGEPATGFHVEFEADGELMLNMIAETDGLASTLVRPGELLVSVGDLEQRVQLEPGEQRILEFSHAQHGDLIFDPKPDKKIAALLRIREVDFPDVARKDLWQSDNAAGFLFADPGEYEVFLKRGYGAAGGRLIGRAVVSARRETRFELIVPTGELTVDITLAAGVQLTSALTVSLHGGATEEGKVDQITPAKLSLTNYRANFPALLPGRYRVKCREGVVEVSVGKGDVSVAMRVEK